jgi:hypothetical protein
MLHQSEFSSDLLRPLGALEELFDLLKQVGSPTVMLSAEIEGPTETQAWKTAIEAVRLHRPLLRAQVKRDSIKRPAFHLAGHTMESILAIRPLDEFALQAFYRKELQTSFDATGPLWRATVFLGESRSILVVAVDHTILDGRGAALLVQDILTAASGAELGNEIPLSVSHDEVLGLVPETVYVPSEPTSASKMIEEDGRSGERTLSIEHLSLEPKLVLDIAAEAKLNGTTLHGALTAAILYAGASLHKPWAEGTVNYVSPIDNRPFMMAPAHFGLFITLASGQFEPARDKNFWQLAQAVRSGISDELNATNSLKAMAGLRDALKSGVAPENSFALLPPLDLMVTNYGSLSIREQYGALTLKSLTPHVISNPLGQTVSAATIDGTMKLSNASFAPIQGLLGETREVLVSLLG